MLFLLLAYQSECYGRKRVVLWFSYVIDGIFLFQYYSRLFCMLLLLVAIELKETIIYSGSGLLVISTLS